jgi:hypothetical protein
MYKCRRCKSKFLTGNTIHAETHEDAMSAAIKHSLFAGHGGCRELMTDDYKVKAVIGCGKLMGVREE